MSRNFWFKNLEKVSKAKNLRSDRIFQEDGSKELVHRKILVEAIHNTRHHKGIRWMGWLSRSTTTRTTEISFHLWCTEWDLKATNKVKSFNPLIKQREHTKHWSRQPRIWSCLRTTTNLKRSQTLTPKQVRMEDWNQWIRRGRGITLWNHKCSKLWRPAPTITTQWSHQRRGIENLWPKVQANEIWSPPTTPSTLTQPKTSIDRPQEPLQIKQ